VNIKSDKNRQICLCLIFIFILVKVDGNQEKLLGERIVKDLSRQLIGRYYQIYFDSFCTTVDLRISVKKGNGILACGIIRSNRNNLPKVQVHT